MFVHCLIWSESSVHCTHTTTWSINIIYLVDNITPSITYLLCLHRKMQKWRKYANSPFNIVILLQVGKMGKTIKCTKQQCIRILERSVVLNIDYISSTVINQQLQIIWYIFVIIKICFDWYKCHIPVILCLIINI